jgi:hypothetical protein
MSSGSTDGSLRGVFALALLTAPPLVDLVSRVAFVSFVAFVDRIARVAGGIAARLSSVICDALDE